MSSEMVRKAAVAGRFYDASPQVLIKQFNQWFKESTTDIDHVRGLIVPHAGYMFSGPTAAKAYFNIVKHASHITRVILVGPSHKYYFQGCALPKSNYFETPLGNVPVDTHLRAELSRDTNVMLSDQMHSDEHCLEVQLPFIQYALSGATVMPVLTSNISPKSLSLLLEPFWNEQTLVIISSDLSHFHSYSEAQMLDSETCEQIEHFDSTLSPEQACGATGINTMLLMAKSRDYHLHKLEQINSGDRYTDKERVVGYVSYVISET
ncbi:AmmeMemoRadiSam system protein B [Vibrio sp. JC009]|uniref:AmmeMemoRadiSam system protein B n=1 Tax=Vibrio sp. JC009 TaxID=2912314 RepID=UPI0023AEC5DF|nr:AmmeMemoRadiSam system protein B [Vibrio sp. JC009]WED20679.1 AmmeMemoRadiSam system protein B [Vibrio sp. JC009]